MLKIDFTTPRLLGSVWHPAILGLSIIGVMVLIGFGTRALSVMLRTCWILLANADLTQLGWRRIVDKYAFVESHLGQISADQVPKASDVQKLSWWRRLRCPVPKRFSWLEGDLLSALLPSIAENSLIRGGPDVLVLCAVVLGIGTALICLFLFMWRLV